MKTLSCLGGGQHRGRVLPIVHDGGQPDRFLAAPRQRVGHVGQAELVVGARQFGGQRGPRLGKRLLGARRQHQHLRPGPGCDRRRAARCLLEDDVGVGAADAERADAGAADAVGLPRPVLAAHPERPAVDVQFRVGAGVVQRRRDRLVLQAQDGLDQTRDAGGRLEVADVGLDRPDIARAAAGFLGRARTPAAGLRSRSGHPAGCRCRASRRSRWSTRRPRRPRAPRR